jgi:two-component sensor histidine kinase
MNVSIQQGTDQPRSLDQLLLEEFTHRINNELAALIAMVVREQATSADETTRGSLRRLYARLVNVGRVQHALQGAQDTTELDLAIYLRQLCVNRETHIEQARISFTGASAILDAQRCRRVGMIVSELLENTRKHAFKEGRGSIRVDLRRHGREIHCRIADDGCGAEGTDGNGRGLQIVRALAESLRGTLSRVPAERGTVWLLTIPH